MSDDAPVLRVATWNIHRCIGADRRRDARRIAQGILALDADLVALQEVEIPTQAAALSSAFELLRELACHGYQVLPGPTIVGHDQGYGNVLLSRLPVRECARTELAHRGGGAQGSDRCAPGYEPSISPSGSKPAHAALHRDAPWAEPSRAARSDCRYCSTDRSRDRQIGLP
ncbi:MAG: hypothetical protein N838_28080 [Thiohalocapsa sp. PB-PSB1]|nr:MAG: hypothetical protein N838_16410 [Thiohalocapsa sp. PB-PSB1]QQO56649.1 MAG: hypothetical protein N838_28080 [Thiohalocapsa sp. PB-PSB1]HCS89762.1 hypothetical protein [Chromatiaceae bacterium]